VFCNGLGGRDVRINERCLTAEQCPWFAAKQSLTLSTETPTPPVAAALFCNYHDSGDVNRARCYLKVVDNEGAVSIRDEFILDASGMPQTPPTPPA
jgi:hypothetical protein